MKNCELAAILMVRVAYKAWKHSRAGTYFVSGASKVILQTFFSIKQKVKMVLSMMLGWYSGIWSCTLLDLNLLLEMNRIQDVQFMKTFKHSYTGQILN